MSLIRWCSIRGVSLNGSAICSYLNGLLSSNSNKSASFHTTQRGYFCTNIILFSPPPPPPSPPPSLVLPFLSSQHYRCLRTRTLQSAAVQGRVVQSTKYPDCPSQKSCTSAPYLPVETSSAFNKKTRNFPSS